MVWNVPNPTGFINEVNEILLSIPHIKHVKEKNCHTNSKKYFYGCYTHAKGFQNEN
jgi:hypothetical protein